MTPDWPGLRPEEGMFLWVYPGVARLCGCIVARRETPRGAGPHR